MGLLFSGLLVQTAKIYRRQQVEGRDKRDRLGQPTRDEVLVHTYPCRCTVAEGGRTNSDRMTDVAVTTHVLYLEPDADIVENDVVTVENPHGAGTFVERAIVQVIKQPVDSFQVHHLEVDMTTERETTDA